MDWISRLESLDLVIKAPQIQVLDFNDSFTIDSAAALMVQGAPQFFASLKPKDKVELMKGFHTRSQSHLPPKDWWPKIKEEFHIFLCTDDKKYDELRRELKSSGGKTSATILSIITASIGSKLGFEAGTIVSLVALCLYALLKIGKEAYCANI
ncbi:hypothetical protein [Nitrosospira sp. NpAV]|uniref:hypothetical protein n=1 Tax=Nitrosospira sp. NpAV TaxID=58133 RepID=UPI00059F2012|nr:hypothetical protein [Nitrosospira sp. NpAV]KIO48336.1 hypothetical protein SQ11_11235 [Nitrosospira sp. NpAV]